MQRYQDKSDDAHETGTSIRLIFAGVGAILLVIVMLMANYPAVSELISAAAQAEFVNPDIAPAGPTQIAQPAEQMRIVRSD
jgi:Na+-transporting methylmalonyl-CoA/oxaloacetate decarboxylase gamma subunit